MNFKPSRRGDTYVRFSANSGPRRSHPPFRLDVQLHDLLKNPAQRPLLPPLPSAKPLSLPQPVFPQHPELLTDEELEADEHGSPTDPYKRHWTAPLVYRAMRGWLFPYVKSRLLPGDFHPIIAYLFTEWKCNLDCHYCWALAHQGKLQRFFGP